MNTAAAAANILRGVHVVYLDENALNRTLAVLMIEGAGGVCAATATIKETVEAIDHSSCDVLVMDMGTAAADPEGIAVARRDPRFRELPLIAVGADPRLAAAIGIDQFVLTPLDPTLFLSAISRMRWTGAAVESTSKGGSIDKNALLLRVSGKTEAAADILGQFITDYSGFGDRIRDALAQKNQEEAEFLLRNLRSAASAVGADVLYRRAAAVQDEVQRQGNEETALLDAAIKSAMESAERLKADFLQAPGSGETQRYASSRRQTVSGVPAAPKSSGTGPARILVVDDSSANRKLIAACLEDEYSIVLASSGDEALRSAWNGIAPDLILLDVTMPGIDGYETCRQLKEDPRTRNVPVIFLTSMDKEKDEERGFALGAADYIRKPFSVPILKARVRNHLNLQRYREYLETIVEERTRELKETQREVVFRLSRAAEYRDNDTGSHIRRIGYYATTIAEEFGFPRTEADLLYFSSPMHDIGKIGIPDHILLKPGKLEPEEWAIMKRHPVIGAGLLEGHPSELLRSAARIALSHHEKWDGTGYPKGLSGEDIPIEGRIVAVCDVFDALLASRPYKRPWTYDEALDEINRLSGTHFDPSVVKAFNSVYPEFIRINEQFRD
jgi:putative two-component system response regulator